MRRTLESGCSVVTRPASMLALSLVALMINSTGCQEEAAKPVGAAAAIADPGPEQAFQLIVEFFKREAAKQRVPYQRMIRVLVDEYTRRMG